jgi:hypothetical protein
LNHGAPGEGFGLFGHHYLRVRNLESRSSASGHDIPQAELADSISTFIIAILAGPGARGIIRHTKI